MLVANSSVETALRLLLQFVIVIYTASPCVKFRKYVSFRGDQKIHLAFFLMVVCEKTDFEA